MPLWESGTEQAGNDSSFRVASILLGFNSRFHLGGVKHLKHLKLLRNVSTVLAARVMLARYSVNAFAQEKYD
jgi:hypothetical protein